PGTPPHSLHEARPIFGKTGNFKEVEISKIEPITIIETVAATGKIQPETEIKISSEVSGEIIALPIIEGQQVKKGDLLVKINPDLDRKSTRLNSSHVTI